MYNKTVRSLGLVWLFTLALAVDAGGRKDEPQLDVQLVADGLVAPLDLTFAPDRSGRRFIVDQTGLVLILTPAGELLPTPFLDIRDRVVLSSAFDERGLLALAFHPRFAANGKLYVHYSGQREGPNICVEVDGRIPDDPAGCPFQYTRRVSEFRVSTADPNRVELGSERVVFKIQWPGRKHNGGGLAFGPDGMLYIGLGDSGASHGIGKKVVWEAFDVPAEALTWDHLAQDRESLYGKVLRIDVNHGYPGYAIPAGNPFAAGPGRDEIWAWGFRNPFRIAFDGKSGDFYVTAVAETLWEAVYRVQGPGNYGWPLREGTNCVDRLKPRQPPRDCPDHAASGERIELPVVEYANMQASHPDTKLGIAGVGTAVTGAHRYRGTGIPALDGKLVVADWSADFKKPSGQIFVADPAEHAGGLWKTAKAMQLDSRIVGLAEDRAGELYVLTNETFGPYGETGKVFRLVPRP
jgi:glucose/arabinose dehydrogenase